MANDMLSRSTAALTGGRAFLCLPAYLKGNVMTEMQSDEERRKAVMLYEIHGISQEDCSAIVSQHVDNTRKLESAEDKIRRARDIVELLKAADANSMDEHTLSLRTLEQLDRVQSLLKSAQKKIDKYGNEQKIRDIENFKQGAEGVVS